MASVEPIEGILPAFARAIKDAFPELEGRSIAVSEVDPFNKGNMPTLPIAVVALLRGLGIQNKSGGGSIHLEDEILLQMIFTSVKYANRAGDESPFFAYYDYEEIRDRVLTVTQSWRSPRNIGLQYRGMDLESDELGTWITFRFGTSQKWCAPDQDVPSPAIVSFRLQPPKSVCFEPCPAEPDPCRPSAE